MEAWNLASTLIYCKKLLSGKEQVEFPSIVPALMVHEALEMLGCVSADSALARGEPYTTDSLSTFEYMWWPPLKPEFGNGVYISLRVNIWEGSCTLKLTNPILNALKATASTEPRLTVNGLANEIRTVDGSNSLGAGALAEALMPYITKSAKP